MTTPEPSASRKKIDQRVDQLATLFTHLEKTAKDLDEVVIDGHQRIDNLGRQIQDLQRRVTENPDTAGDRESD